MGALHDVTGPKRPLVTAPAAATQLRQTGHSSIVQHFEDWWSAGRLASGGHLATTPFEQKLTSFCLPPSQQH